MRRHHLALLAAATLAAPPAGAVGEILDGAKAAEMLRQCSRDTPPPGERG